MVAHDKGYFDEEGVKVELREFTAGKFALQAFLAGSLDYAVSGEVPVTLAAVQGNDFRVIAQVVKRTMGEIRVVALRDESASDPRTYFRRSRRRLATSFGGGPEFFTHAFLQANGLSERDVELMSQKPEDMPAALLSRSVDAIAVFDPFAYMAESRIGHDAVTFQDAGGYSELYVLSATRKAIDADRDASLAILRALSKAEDFIARNGAQAQQIVARYTRLDAQAVAGVWGNFDFGLALTEQLVKYQRAQVAWAQSKEPRALKLPAPDPRSWIDSSLLAQVRPTSIDIDSEEPD